MEKENVLYCLDLKDNVKTPAFFGYAVTIAPSMLHSGLQTNFKLNFIVHTFLSNFINMFVSVIA